MALKLIITFFYLYITYKLESNQHLEQYKKYKVNLNEVGIIGICIVY